MEIKLENINFKKDAQLVFDNLNINIPCKKIIGLTGDKYNEIITLLKTKDFNSGKLIDNYDYLEKVLIFDNNDHFVTNIVFDEIYLNLGYNDELQTDIIEILNKFDLNINYLNKHISTLSALEKRILNLLIIMFSTSKMIVLNNFFNGLDYKNKKIFIKLIKSLKRLNKTILIYDYDIDLIYALVDYLLIVDSKLVVIEKIKDVFNLDDVKNISIKYPNIVILKKLINDRQISLNDFDNINDFIKELERK